MASPISTPKSALPQLNDYLGSLPGQTRMAIEKIIPENQIQQAIVGTVDPGIVIENLLLQSVATKVETLGPEHVETLTTIHALAMVQTELGQNAQAEQNYRKLLEISERQKGPNTSWAAMSNLSWILNKQGKYAEAEGILRRLLPRLQSRMGKDSPQALGCLRHLMEAMGGQGRYAEAMEMNLEGLEMVGNMAEEYKPEEVEAMKEMKAQLEQGQQRQMIEAS